MPEGHLRIHSQKKFYYIYLLSIATLITFNQAVIQWHINAQKSDARLINIAGRQRMFSQQIVKLVLLSEKSDAYWETIKKRNYEWNFIQESLQKGNDSLRIPAADNFKLSLLFKEIKVYKDAVSNAVNNLVVDTSRRVLYETIILENERKYLPVMENIVSTIETQSELKVKGLIITEIILAVLSLVGLLLEFKLLFVPWLNEMVKDQVKITKKERQLDEISRIQSHEVRKPVANIIALVNLIEDEPDWAAKNSEILEMLKSSAEELDNAIKKVVLQIRHENDISLPA